MEAAATATRVTSAVPGRRTPRRRACSHPTRRPAKSSPSVTPSPTNNVPIYEPRERRRTGETASRAARHRPIRPAHATISGAPCHPLGPKVNPAIVPAFSLMHPCRPSPPPSQAIPIADRRHRRPIGSNLRRGMRIRGHPPRGTRPGWVTPSVPAWCAPKAVQNLTVPCSTRAHVLIVE